MKPALKLAVAVLGRIGVLERVLGVDYKLALTLGTMAWYASADLH